MHEVSASDEALLLILIHGAGHTSLTWQATQRHLSCASLAVDLSGRRDRPADIVAVTIADAADSIAADIDAATSAPVVLVGHSVGGIVLPAVAARLGPRVRRLVFVAGLSAADGETVADTLRPGGQAEMTEYVEKIRGRHAGHMLDPHAPGDCNLVIHDPKTAMTVDSLNHVRQRVSWHGVPESLERTFVRCLRDPIQSRELQEQLIRNCRASRVIEIDSGHSPALDAPRELAAILDDIADDAAIVADTRCVTSKEG